MIWGTLKRDHSGDSAERLERICESTPIADTHNDLPYLLRLQLHNEFQGEKRFTFGEQLASNTDIPRLRKGRIGMQFFSCFIECKEADHLYQDFNRPNSAVRDTMEQIDVTKRLVQAYPEDLALVDTADEALDQYKNGRIAVALGVEGLHQVDSSLAVLRMYHELGVRYITLTHNCDNPFATAASSVVGGLSDRGLSEFGKRCVVEMNRLGLMVDLSHVSLKTMHDALEVTKAPVIFSHSSVYALTPNERNVRDEVLHKVKQNGGVVCVNFFPHFLQQSGRSSVTIDDAVDHIMHIVDLIGWDHVGFGSDFDGIPCGPEGLEDVSKYPDLVCRLMERSGAGDEEIAKAMGGNVLRVWRETDALARMMAKKGAKPEEANWEKREWKFFRYLTLLPELFPGAYGAKENKYDDSQSLVLTE